MANQYQNRTQTSTQIRNLYSEGMSYLNIRFFNTSLSFHLHPFTGKDPNGKSQYNSQVGVQTTVMFEGAYALWKTGTDILDGTLTEVNLVIPCLNDASIRLERSANNNNGYDTVFSITKANNTISFKFSVTPYQVKENGSTVTKYMETGLGAFVKTIDGYLTGINSDRHLDKLTDDFAKIQDQNSPQNQNQSSWQQRSNNNYRQNNRYRPNNYQRGQNGNGWNNNGGNNQPMNMNNYSISSQ